MTKDRQYNWENIKKRQNVKQWSTKHNLGWGILSLLPYKTLHRKQKTDQFEPHQKSGVKSCAPERYTVPAQLIIFDIDCYHDDTHSLVHVWSVVIYRYMDNILA